MLKAEQWTTTIVLCCKSCGLTMLADDELVMELSGGQIIAFYTEWQNSEPSRCTSLHDAVKCAVLWLRQILNQLGAKLLLSLLLLFDHLYFHSLAVSNMVCHGNLIPRLHDLL